MNFDQALPLLVSSYRRGELVPFIGLGMSRRACSTWDQLILGLERKPRESPTINQLRASITQVPENSTENELWDEWHSVKLNTLGFKVLRRKTPAHRLIVNNMISISLYPKPSVSES